MTDDNPVYSVIGNHLGPIQDLLDRPDVSEVALNEPGRIWYERAGAHAMESRPQPEYSAERLMRLANSVANESRQRISQETPLLSGSLPGVGRIQLVYSPVVSSGVAFAIRRSSPVRRTLQQYADEGMFDQEEITKNKSMTEDDEKLLTLYQKRKIREFLQMSVIYKKNIIISGGTSSGKTTFANAMLAEIPADERIITIEDARELTPKQENHLALVASRGGQNRAKVDTTELLKATLRLRPDRILLGELRGAEAYPFIRAINTGHPGALTTIHADTASGALTQLAMLVLESGLRLDFDHVRQYVAHQIDVIVQLGRSSGIRRVEKVFFRHAENQEI